MLGRSPELGESSEVPQNPINPPANRGSERFLPIVKEYGTSALNVAYLIVIPAMVGMAAVIGTAALSGITPDQLFVSPPQSRFIPSMMAAELVAFVGCLRVADKFKLLR